MISTKRQLEYTKQMEYACNLAKLKFNELIKQDGISEMRFEICISANDVPTMTYLCKQIAVEDVYKEENKND